jgi:hypothetical protein
MPRPRSENPRDVRLVVKLTAGERGQVGELAAAAGLSVSDYVRGRALVARPAALLERTEPVVEPGVCPTCRAVDGRHSDDCAWRNGVSVRASVSSPSDEAPKPLHRCPKFDGCGFAAPSVKARCPVHGCTVKP